MLIDHRRLGRELDLFDSDPLIGAGLPFWLPAGAAARHEVESYVRELERRAGYQHVYSPVLGKREMFELSGHWQNFADDMFPPMRLGASGDRHGGDIGDGGTGTATATATRWCCDRVCARITRWSSGRGSARTGICRCGSPSSAACTGPSAPGCSAA